MSRLKLASEYYTRNQVGAALRELMNAQDINNEHAPLQNMLGIVNMDLHRYDDAEKAFQKALKLDKTNNPDIHNNYGWFLCVSGQYTKGLDWLSKAWNNPLYSTPVKALYNSGRCSKMASDNTQALEFFTKALIVSPRSTAIMYELAHMQYELKNYQNTLDVIDRMHEIDGTSPQSLWLALRSEYRLGHKNEVESYGQQLIRKYPNAAETTLWVSKSL
jgi:type IV pilus assembly protein PilF